MVYTSTAEKKIRLYTKHTGFMRVALASGAALVPIFTYVVCGVRPDSTWVHDGVGTRCLLHVYICAY